MKPRKPIKRLGKKGKAKADLSASAKELYFQRFGDGETAPCHLCGGPMEKDNCDIHHKFRRWKNLNEPIHLVALHRMCHARIHSDRAIENFLASEACDIVGCAQGGKVTIV